MSGMQPVGVFAMKVKAGEMVPGSMKEGPMVCNSLTSRIKLPLFGGEIVCALANLFI